MGLNGCVFHEARAGCDGSAPSSRRGVFDDNEDAGTNKEDGDFAGIAVPVADEF